MEQAYINVSLMLNRNYNLKMVFRSNYIIISQKEW